MKGSKKGRGRPPKPRDKRRSKNRTFRVRGLMDDYLITHASLSGRSVSEEIEARLERSICMDGVMQTFAGDVAPMLNAISTAVGHELLSKAPLADRYRRMQAAVGYIIAAFGSSNTATIKLNAPATRTPVSDLRWPPLNGKPAGHEEQGLITAYWVLQNLNPLGLSAELTDLANILGHDILRLELP